MSKPPKIIEKNPHSARLWQSELRTVRRSRSKWRHLFKRAIQIAFIVCIAVSIGGSLITLKWLQDIGALNFADNRLESITNHRHSDNSIVYDRNGQKIGEFFENYHVFIPFSELPEPLIAAIIAIEDQNFFEHKGFDPRAILRAVTVQLRGSTSKQGASTITQQVVRQFLLSNEKTFSRKAIELSLAIQLEKKISKNRIFEIYVNSSFLGNGAYGVGAAAQRYFGKKISELTLAESAVIAGLFQSPSRYNPARRPAAAKARQLQVINAMLRQRKISRSEAATAKQQALIYKNYVPVNGSQAPHFVDHVREEAKKILGSRQALLKNGGLRIFTTLDHNLQKLAENAIAYSSAHFDAISKQAPPVLDSLTRKLKPVTLEAAMLVTDPVRGEILAMVGGRDYRKSQFNRTTQAMRAPGSAFKPIVYSLALAGTTKWSDLAYVAPVTFDTYRPRSQTGDYGTETTLLRAFYRSINAPTVELGQQLGLERITKHALALGVRSPIKNEYGSVLGSSDLRMTDLARVYGTFANRGSLTELISITKIVDQSGTVIWESTTPETRTTKVLSEQTAFLMTQGLRAVLSAGTGFKSADLATFAAGKTGTSNDATDNWFCGFTTDLVSIVWVGSDDRQPLVGDFTAGTIALPVWDRFMRDTFRSKGPKPFVVPVGIAAAKVNPNFGHLAEDGMTMYFITGTEPKHNTSPLEALQRAGKQGYREIFMR